MYIYRHEFANLILQELRNNAIKLFVVTKLPSILKIMYVNKQNCIGEMKILARLKKNHHTHLEQRMWCVYFDGEVIGSFFSENETFPQSRHLSQ